MNMQPHRLEGTGKKNKTGENLYTTASLPVEVLKNATQPLFCSIIFLHWDTLINIRFPKQ